MYPGGSAADKTATGYSWTDNYWCNLLNEKAINGQNNIARPVAMIGMFTLALSLFTFWIMFPALTQLKRYHMLLIQVPGTVSTLASFLLLTRIDHDLAVNASSAFGLIAMTGILVALYKLKSPPGRHSRAWKSLFAVGLFDLMLVALNNYLYHSNQIMYLPVIQKITFLSFLIWFSFASITLYQRSKVTIVFSRSNQ